MQPASCSRSARVIRQLSKTFHRFVGDERGVAFVFSSLLMTALIGISALAAEVGLVLLTQARLQSSTDAAALAGAQDLNAPVAGTYLTSVRNYSASATFSGRNQLPGQTVAVDVQTRCLTSVMLTCGGTDSANALVVTQ